MQLTKLVLLGILLTSCGPNRPAVTICFYSDQAHVAKCTDPKGKDFDCDSACMDKAFVTQDWQKILDYITALERKATSCRQR